MREQNKKRKYNRDQDGRDERDDRERTPEEQDDPLKDATTLYVGNLWVFTNASARGVIVRLTPRRSFYTTEEQIHELFAK